MVADAFDDDDLTVTIRATDHAHAALRAGITTLRDCGSRHRVVSRVRDAIRLGITGGPRLLLSGSVITTTGGHMYFVGREVDDPLELPRAVREQVRAGADFIKVTNTGGGLVPGNGTAYLQFDRKALRLIIEEAGQLGVHVAVHSLSTEGIAEVIEARPAHGRASHLPQELPGGDRLRRRPGGPAGGAGHSRMSGHRWVAPPRARASGPPSRRSGAGHAEAARGPDQGPPGHAPPRPAVHRRVGRRNAADLVR